MTYTIQALAGVAVALSAVLSVVFRRTRKAIFKFIGYDENAKKDIEAEIIKQECQLEEKAQFIYCDDHKKLFRAKTSSLGQKQKKAFKIVISSLCSVGFVLTVVTVPTLDLFISSSNALIFNPNSLIPFLMIVSVTLALMIFLILLIIKEKHRLILIAIITTIALLCWLQMMFINGPLPAADGESINMSNYQFHIFLDIAIWITVIITFIGLAVIRKKESYLCSLLICTALIIIQSTALVTIAGGNQVFTGNPTAKESIDADDKNYAVTTNGLYEVSSKENVIVFIIDTLDNGQLSQAELTFDDIYDDYTGFTRYVNCSGSYFPTQLAVPYLLTGNDIKDDENFGDYLNRRFKDSHFIKDIYDQGYEIGLYSDTLSDGRPELYKYTTNIKKDLNFPINYIGTLQMFAKIICFKCLPWTFKEIFWFTTDELNQNILINDGSSTAPYLINDYKYYQTLKEYKRLSISQNTNTNSFRFIHLQGPHKPIDMDKDLNPVTKCEDNLDARLDKLYACMKIVREYIVQLKELGVYDNSTIIISGDHGMALSSHQDDGSQITYPESPGFLIKYKNGAGNKMSYNSSPISLLDFQATILKEIGADYKAYGTPIDEIELKYRERPYTIRLNSEQQTGVALQKYIIKGIKVTDIDNWEKTSVYHEIPEDLRRKY
ncbi:MAG: sulfatase-like hydrolase/transferase [Coriobacteriales bacterium]|nr:sulfatase-like hydrolase/transferase [Coriobacteriales bacterium]